MRSAYFLGVGRVRLRLAVKLAFAASWDTEPGTVRGAPAARMRVYSWDRKAIEEELQSLIATTTHIYRTIGRR